MDLKITNIKIIKLINGDDIVCALSKEQLPEKSSLLRIEKPLQIKYVSNITPTGLTDYIALIKWVSFTNDKVITIPKDKILAITNATLEMVKSYAEVASKYDKIIVPKQEQERYNQKLLNKKQNDEFNELWDEFRDILKDGTDTIH
jgi:hypothetical protein